MSRAYIVLATKKGWVRLRYLIPYGARRNEDSPKAKRTYWWFQWECTSVFHFINGGERIRISCRWSTMHLNYCYVLCSCASCLWIRPHLVNRAGDSRISLAELAVIMANHIWRPDYDWKLSSWSYQPSDMSNHSCLNIACCIPLTQILQVMKETHCMICSIRHK